MSFDFRRVDWDGLQRYANGLIERHFDPVRPSLPLQVTFEDIRSPYIADEEYPFHGASIEILLDFAPFPHLLLGGNRTGRTTAVRHSLVRQARRILEALTSGEMKVSDEIRAPIYFDLREAKDGLLTQLSAWRDDIDVELWINGGRVHFLLDHWDTLDLESAVGIAIQGELAELLKRHDKNRWTIVSTCQIRRELFPAACFRVTQIDEAFVRNALADWGALPERPRDDALVTLLCAPACFDEMLHERISVSPLPTDFELLHSLLQSQLEGLGPVDQAIQDFGRMAQRLLDQRLAHLDQLEIEFLFTRPRAKTASLLTNGVDSGLLVRAASHRYGFSDDLIAEYLAALTLAPQLGERLDHYEQVVRRNWPDRAIQWLLRLVNDEVKDKCFEQLMKVDFVSALQSVRAESNEATAQTDRILGAILGLGPNHGTVNRSVATPLKSLPVNTSHAEKLRKLLEFPDDGGICELAAKLLIDAIGDAALEPILDAVLLNEHGIQLHDESICAFLRHHVTLERLPALLQRCNDPHIGGITAGFRICRLLVGATSRLDCGDVIATFQAVPHPGKLLRSAMIDWAGDVKGDAACRWLIDLVTSGETEAVSPLYFSIRYGEGIDWLIYLNSQAKRTEFFSGLEQCLTKISSDELIIELFHELQGATPYAEGWLKDLCHRSAGVLRIALLHLLEGGSGNFWEHFTTELKNAPRAYADWEIAYLRSLKTVDWRSHDRWLLDAAESVDLVLVESLLGEVYFGKHFTPEFRRLSSPLPWTWIEERMKWVASLDPAKQKWAGRRLASFFWLNRDADAEQRLLDAVNSAGEGVQELIVEHVLGLKADLSAAELSEHGVAAILARFRRSVIRHVEPGSILVRIADEAFTEKYLLPRLGELEEPFHSNLRVHLREIGERHGKRYC